jgi:hypothetical protein
VKAELKLPKLDVKLNPVTSATRIPLMANGTIDLECGSTTNNVERQKQVAYTKSHFLTANRYVSKVASAIRTIDDLKGKTVVSTAGTTNIKQLVEANTARNLAMNIIPAKDHAEAFLMVETDRAVAFVMDDILLAGLVAAAKEPHAYVISSDAFAPPEPYGIMLRKMTLPSRRSPMPPRPRCTGAPRGISLCQMVQPADPPARSQSQCAYECSPRREPAPIRRQSHREDLARITRRDLAAEGARRLAHRQVPHPGWSCRPRSRRVPAHPA